MSPIMERIELAARRAADRIKPKAPFASMMLTTFADELLRSELERDDNEETECNTTSSSA
jgi:hypothetical protein